jgi:recombination protein RecT
MNTPAPQNTAKQVALMRFQGIQKQLEERSAQFGSVLPKHLTPQRLIRIALTTISNNPKLQECDLKSLVSAVMTAAQLGLEPDGITGQAYIVPFNSREGLKAQLIPGYKGLLTLVRNGGDVTEIYAHEVRENDEFQFDYGSNTMHHKFPLSKDFDRGEVIAYYAMAKYKGGGQQMEIMTIADIDAIRDASQGYKAAIGAHKKYNKSGTPDTPWVTHYNEMARKTAIRRIVKYLPINVNKVQQAVTIDEAATQGRYLALTDKGEFDVEMETVEGEVLDNAPVAQTKTQNLKDQLAAQPAETEQPSKEPEQSRPAAPGDAGPAEAPKDLLGATPTKNTCPKCKGACIIDWYDPETGEVGTEPCPECGATGKI